MKKIILRIISNLLVFSILSTIITVLPTSAAKSIYDDGNRPYHAYLDAMIDANSGNIAGNWGKAVFVYGLPWNYFHKEVQEHIRNNPVNQVEEKELYMMFNQGSKKGKKGYADLYRTTPAGTYIWEVKPLSYAIPPKLYTAAEQLMNYVNNSSEYKLGNTDGINILGESFPSSNGLYQISYVCENNGLIFYWFKEIEKDEENDESSSDVPMIIPIDTFNDNSGSGSGSGGQDSSDHPPITTNVPATTAAAAEVADTTAKEEFAYEAINAVSDAFSKFGKSITENPVESEIALIAISVPLLKAIEAKLIASGCTMTFVPDIISDKELIVACTAFLTFVSADLLSLPIKVSAAGNEYIELDRNSEDFANIQTVISDVLLLLPNFDSETASELYEQLMSENIDMSDEMLEEIKNQSDSYEESQDLFQSDPLIINFSGTDEIEFTSLAEGINFDLDNNGFDEKTAWIKNNDGFLAIDLNGNEKIDNGGELFGDRFIMLNGKKSFDGFEALSSLDTNKNGKIDDNDDLFGNVSVNQNETDEEYTTLFDQLVVWYGDESRKDFVSLKSLNVDYIDLACFPDPYIYNTDTEDVRSTRREKTSYVYFKDGTARKHISEFWFDVNTTSTVHDGEITVGNVKTIEQAIYDDKTGELIGLCRSFNYVGDIAQKHYYLKKILYFITDSSDIPIKSRGGNIDARDLHVIETFMGHEFIGVNNDKNPNALAAAALKEIYKNIENSYYNALNFKMSFGGYMTITFENEDENGNRFLDISLLNEVIEKKIENNDYNAQILMYDLGVYLKSYDKIHKTNEFIKYRDYYSAKSQEYAEIIELIGNNDTFIGAESNDTYTGSAKIDFVFGEDGNNTLYGSSANDQIYSGYGNDVMNGNTGDDSYYFGMYHGNDIVNDAEGNCKIVFIDGFSVDDYDTSVLFNGRFVLTNKYTGDTITLTDFITHPFNYDFFSYNGSQTVGGGDSREVVEGSDADDYLDASDGFNIFYAGEGNDTIAGGNNIDFMYGGNGDDTLLGRNGTNIIYGEGGTDTIYDGDHSSYLNGGDDDDEMYGGGGDDILDGGAGNDILQGDHGNDTFIYDIGYDIDTFKDAAGEPNTIIIHGYHKSDMNNFRDGSNLIIDFGKNTGDRMIIERFFDYAANSDITFIFDDGTSLSRFDIRAKSLPIYGDENNNHINGTDEADIIDGGTGDDTLCGFDGEDTYVFSRTYGHDIINEWGSDHSFVEFKDINSDEITIEKQDSNLNIYVNETEDELTILNFVYGASTFTFRFTDGAEGYVDKNTYEFIFTKQPDPVYEANIKDSDISEGEDVSDEEIDEVA